jgi:uncharacterized protein involved in exopolysaccharide biosynthesis
MHDPIGLGAASRNASERPGDRLIARDRLARGRARIRRALGYWRGVAVLCAVGGALSVAFASRVVHAYRSESTVFARPRIRTDDRDDSSMSPDQMLRQAARLKDMLTTRSRLETVIKRFHLYGETVAHRTMLDAVEEMKPHVGFRSLEGAQYVISFDGDDPDTVQKVTEYLSKSLIEDYAAADLEDLHREADFLAREEDRSLGGLEESTRALTVFLAAHPEFAMEAKQAASPFGVNPTAGIPLMPKPNPLAAPVMDPELAALYRERVRLEGEVRASTVSDGGVAQATASGRELSVAIAQAQAQVEAAAKRVAEAQADLASKSNLTDDHPDMRAARLTADAAARQLHEANAALASLQQRKATGAALPPSLAPPEIADKLRRIDGELAVRHAARARTSSSSAGEGAGSGPNPAVTAVVELETEWQRLLRALNEAKADHDDLKLRAERAKLALEAARAQASERMAIVDPPYRPTHPSKGGRANAAAAGLAMTLLLGVAYASARVALDDTLLDADDVEALGLVPVLGVLPELGGGRKAGSKELSVDALP